MSKHVEVKYNRDRDQFDVSILISEAKAVIVFSLGNAETLELVKELKREVLEKLDGAQKPKVLRLIAGGGD